MSRPEVRVILSQLSGVPWLVGQLRIKDLDFDRHQILVLDHLEVGRRLHTLDLTQGRGAVTFPDAINRKYPGATKSWPWQFVFPAGRICRDARWGPPSRFHLHDTVIQREISRAARVAGLGTRVSCHTCRHSFATHVLQRGALGVQSPADRL